MNASIAGVRCFSADSRSSPSLARNVMTVCAPLQADRLKRRHRRPRRPDGGRVIPTTFPIRSSWRAAASDRCRWIGGTEPGFFSPF